MKESNIISIQLDLIKEIRFRNPIELSSFISKIRMKNSIYLSMKCKCQMKCLIPISRREKITFYDVLNELREAENLDVYVIGSNTKMLSSDILTEFRGRSDAIRVHPLSFGEYYSVIEGDKEDAFDQYAFYDGMPFVITRPDDVSKMKYLESLFRETYLKDIIERNKLMREDAFFFSEAKRYDVRGRLYFDYPYKYYCGYMPESRIKTTIRYECREISILL